MILHMFSFTNTKSEESLWPSWCSGPIQCTDCRETDSRSGCFQITDRCIVYCIFEEFVIAHKKYNGTSFNSIASQKGVFPR